MSVDPHIPSYQVPCPKVAWADGPHGPKPYKTVVVDSCVTVEDVVLWLQRTNNFNLSERFMESVKLNGGEISIASSKG